MYGTKLAYLALNGELGARLCSGGGATTTCTLYEPAWQGRTLQLVTYTKSGSGRLEIFEIPGTGLIRPKAPIMLSALSYGSARSH